MVLFGSELVLITIALALLFDFFNGVNDAANSIATVVATKVLRPAQAVVLAAFFNFLGPFAFGTAVAATVGKGIIDPDFVTTQVILAALVGGIAWTWLASHYGMPISVSHSLIGGLVGAGLAVAGSASLALPTAEAMLPALTTMRNGAVGGAALAVALVLVARGRNVVLGAAVGAVVGSALWLAARIFMGVVSVKGLFAVVLFIAYSPLLGFIGGYGLNLAVLWLFRRAGPSRMRRWFGVLQLGSASFYSLGHGTNDGQKTMGVIMALLIANGVVPAEPFHVPVWVILISAGAIALGTMVGGYKVVRTLGVKLTHLEPHQGFSAETSSAIGLYFLAQNGVPVSTTHSIAGSIMGVGALRGRRAVRWEVARTILGAWFLTIPASALVAAVAYYILAFALRFTG